VDQSSSTPRSPLSDVAAELTSIERDYPDHQIWREIIGDRDPRYVAHARSLVTHPHTVITGDLGELRTALGGDR
jgi:hypothetical protein